MCYYSFTNLPFLSGKFCVRIGYYISQFCSNECLIKHKNGLKICNYCQKDITKANGGFLTPIGNKFKEFCSKSCVTNYDNLTNNRVPEKPVAECVVCKQHQIIPIIVEHKKQTYYLCSEPCFRALKFSHTITPENCHQCRKYYELTTLNFTIHDHGKILHFCGKVCLNVYIIATRKIVACQWCKVRKYDCDMIQKESLIVCSVSCLALHRRVGNRLEELTIPTSTSSPNSRVLQKIIFQPRNPPEIKNKATMCKPSTHTKGIMFKPNTKTKDVQTEQFKMQESLLVPIPVPIYVPVPMMMYSMPVPIAVPFPMPVPVPIFIPTSRNSAEGIRKELEVFKI